MNPCASCGRELPGEFPFCPFCGAATTDAPPAPSLEERKVVSVLFCDLVGFTAASDAADPEDVRARIRPYHALLRQEIERYGGTVEKFVGDAVMAVFGAPVAHEDDAERAVRAGLRILEAIEGLNAADPSLSLQVRVGVNTGEAVVTLGARPELGEGIVTGDVVNTASRLQAAAPVDAIAVSEQTYRATERVFTFEPLEPVRAKGKADLLALWQPLHARARLGADITRTRATPLVGRGLEKPLLIGTFERAAEQRSCQLVTIVGEPGVGKSRLCAELFDYLEERPGLVTWRQGRCLPYGDGIAFWALGEVVKAECGILESDSAEQAAAKIEQALGDDASDRAWLKERLTPLAGAGGESASQAESFTAWRRFCESLASERPAVLCFEDLHWADGAMLAFLEYLADWSHGVPLLVLCTARPELFERYPHFGAEARNAQRINLAPLSNEEMTRLIASLLERAVLPEAAQRALLERTGGNPLYAEEFVRLLADRELLTGTMEAVPLPDSVRALIAARLDTLSAERKSLLQDAAVIGNVFWSGALAEMGGREQAEVEQALHELARKELVRPARSSSMEGETEYGFWHVLVRDVCYEQIPRAARAVRHRSVAAWIERKAGERAEDLADVLAHHYLTALELARATGQTETTDDLAAGAIRYLALAGVRALALDVGSAEASLAKGLELAPVGHPERAGLLERWARAAHLQGRLQDAKSALEEAIAIYRAEGELLAAGRALTTLVTTLWALGDPRRQSVVVEALALLQDEPPGPELVAAYAELAGVRFVDAALPEAVAAANRALEVAAVLGLPEPARALGFRGGARSHLGEREGLDDMRRALERALQDGTSREPAVLQANIAMILDHYEGPEAAMRASREAIEFCERRGIAEFALADAAQARCFLVEMGLPEQALADAESLAQQAEASGHFTSLNAVRSVQLRLLAQRGDGAQAIAAAERLADRSRDTGIPGEIVTGFAASAQLLFAAGRKEHARSLLDELGQVAVRRDDPTYAQYLPELARCALGLSDLAVARRLVDGVEPRTPLQGHALCAARAALAEAAGDLGEATSRYAEAAARWRDFGNVPELAFALLGHGRSLVALGRHEAEEPLRDARDLFRSMGYGPALEECEALLGRASAAAG
ncbi:MAG: hypothetical protein QOF28_3094 [Actinomycetota bacterium]|nr:hypothetical protein [Actinomycetota bacterium]